MRSWLGYVSPYVRSLELRVDELNNEREKMLERVVRLTTGYGLSEPVPNVAQEVEQAIDIQKKQQEVFKGIPSGRPRVDEVLREAERLSIQMDARQTQGIDLKKELEELDREGEGDPRSVAPAVRIVNQGR